MPLKSRCFLRSFCKETITGVKTFLVQYCEEQTEAGYAMVKDPLLTFNEVMSIGSDWDFGLDIDEILHGPAILIGFGFSTLAFLSLVYTRNIIP